MERRTFAVWLVLTGLLVGLLGNILFYGKVLGLSFPLFVVIVVAVLLASSRPIHKTLPLRNLWPLIPLLFFAVMVAVRADTLIMTLDIMAVLALGGLVLHYMPSERHIDDDPLTGHASGIVDAGLYLIPGAAPEVADSARWLSARVLRNRGPVVAIGRGLLITVPVVVIFALLLGSADVVFGDYVHRIMQVFAFPNTEEWFWQTLFTFGVAWAATGALAYGLARRPPPERNEATSLDEALVADFEAGIEAAHEMAGDTEKSPDDVPVQANPAAQGVFERPPKRIAKPFLLGIIESGIILGSVDLLFGAFVVIQFAYFFGGRENISVGGLTYAQYARRGFFELVAVSILTLGLILFLDWVTVRDGKRQNMAFRVLSVVIVALTVVMLVSASRRMWLYEEAYGFTHLRVYTHVFMVWLGILLGVFLLSLFRVRMNVFSLGVILVIVGYLGTLNLMNVDLYIAERNIDRYHQGRELDVRFLRILSADALPVMIDLYNEAKSDPIIQEGIGGWLARQLNQLDVMRSGFGSTAFSANLARDQAWSTLDAMRAGLPSYSAAAYRGWDYNYTPPASTGAP